MKSHQQENRFRNTRGIEPPIFFGGIPSSVCCIVTKAYFYFRSIAVVKDQIAWLFRYVAAGRDVTNLLVTQPSDSRAGSLKKNFAPESGGCDHRGIGPSVPAECTAEKAVLKYPKGAGEVEGIRRKAYASPRNGRKRPSAFGNRTLQAQVIESFRKTNGS